MNKTTKKVKGPTWEERFNILWALACLESFLTHKHEEDRLAFLGNEAKKIYKTLEKFRPAPKKKIKSTRRRV